MEIIYRIKGIDCVKCAQELEDKLNKINDVKTTFNFINSKLICSINDVLLIDLIEKTIINFENEISILRLK